MREPQMRVLNPAYLRKMRETWMGGGGLDTLLIAQKWENMNREGSTPSLLLGNEETQNGEGVEPSLLCANDKNVNGEGVENPLCCVEMTGMPPCEWGGCWTLLTVWTWQGCEWGGLALSLLYMEKIRTWMRRACTPPVISRWQRHAEGHTLLAVLRWPQHNGGAYPLHCVKMAKTMQGGGGMPLLVACHCSVGFRVVVNKWNRNIFFGHTLLPPAVS